MHRRGAESAESAENFIFCLSGDDDKQKIALLKTVSFAQSSSPDWAKILTSAYSASLR